MACSAFGGSPKKPKIPVPEPLPKPVAAVVPVQQVAAKEEEDALRKQYAKKMRATLLAQGIANKPNIYQQKLGATL
jgi:hypothetical protein